MDLEGTLVKYEFWEEMAREINNYELLSLLKRGLTEGNWLQTFYKRVELIKGVPKDLIISVSERIVDRIEEEAKILVKVLKEKGFDVMVVSGGFEEFVSIAAQTLDVNNYICNKFIYDNDNRVSGAIAIVHNKGEVVDLVRKWYNKVLAVGDGMNDYEMLRKADIGISLGLNKPDIITLKTLKDVVTFVRERL